MTEVLLDYDNREPPKTLMRRFAFLAKWLECRFSPVVVTKTKNGFHVRARCSINLSNEGIVAVQAIMGSDWKRETYNLMRARNLSLAPAFWRSRSNVFYLRKLEE